MRDRRPSLDERKQETSAAPAVDEVDASVGARSLALLQRELSRGDRAVQRIAAAGPEAQQDAAAVQQIAAEGVSGAGGPLPHQDTIQRSFGDHDVSHVQAHVGGSASGAAGAIGAEAYATGDRVAFAQAPDLHTAAHEAAHVVQQQSGVALLGGVGREGDAHEHHADAVADRVVAGESAEELLSTTQKHDSVAAASPAVQRKAKGSPLVGNLLAAIDQSARIALNQIDEHDDLEAAVQAVPEIIARIAHLLSITAAPGEEHQLDAHAADARLAFGHTQELAARMQHGGAGLAAGRLEFTLERLTSEIGAEAGWQWEASPGSSGKAGKGLTRKEDAAIVTATLDVIEDRLAAVHGTSELRPLRVTMGAVAEDLGHAAREATLAATKADVRKRLAKDVTKFQKKLHKFRDQLAANGTWRLLPIDTIKMAEIELLESVGLPTGTATWDAPEEYQAGPGDDERSTPDGEGSSAGVELVASPDAISFGAVRVGRTAKQTTVGITNTDPDRTVTLDTVQDMTREGLGEFPVYAINSRLEPGATANLPVAFEPARAGSRGGHLKVLGDLGAGAYIAVEGEGVESDEHREDRVETQNNAVKAARSAAGVAHYQERTVAEATVEQWLKNLTLWAEGTAYWASSNWTRFISETGGDFHVAWTEGQFINAVGAVGSTVAGIITAPAGPVASAVAGTLFSLIYGGVFTAMGNADDEANVHDTLKKAGQKIAERSDLFEDKKEAALSEARDAQSTAVSRIWSASDVADILTIQDSMQAEMANILAPPKRSDRTLYELMLKDWVLERSGNSKKANKETNDPAYLEAREHTLGVKKNDRLVRRDLYLYQARHEWSKLGLGGIDKAEDELREQFAKAEQNAIASGNTSDADLASVVKFQLDGPWKFLPVVDPKQTAKVLQEINANYEARDYHDRILGCELWLDIDGGSIYVRNFGYHLDGHHLGNRSPL